MSEQEQDAIASEALLSYHKNKKKLACLEKQASDAKAALEFVGDALKNPSQYLLVGDDFQNSINGKRNSYPTGEEVRRIFAGLVIVKKEINELANSLHRMGYDISS